MLFLENGIATIVRGVGAGQRGRIAFGVVWQGVKVALARVEKAKGKGGTPPRETSYPGKSSSTAARMQAGKGWTSKPSGENSIPVSISPDVVSQLLNHLQSLGGSQQVMGEIRTKTSQASQKARVVPARTRRVAELEEKWLRSASHLENLREQTKRKEERARLSCKHGSV